MELSNVRMVVTDMDGTLLNSKSQVSHRFFELFDELAGHGVHFVAASGRQYSSIFEKLQRINERISIVAENGGYVKSGSQELHSVVLDKQRIHSMIPELRRIPGLYTVLCGKQSAYIESNDRRFTDILGEFYTHFKVVNDLHSVDYDEFFKVSLYHFEGSEAHVYRFVRHLESHLNVKISGKNWIDISDPSATKGTALKKLQGQMGISFSETMVFGDFNNDLEMLREGYFSYAMANAHPNVKATARFSTLSNDEQGVEFVLEQLLAAKQGAEDKTA
jgi:Cof subfamily protein (haloacid dehalogenase superfamily)